MHILKISFLKLVIAFHFSHCRIDIESFRFAYISKQHNRNDKNSLVGNHVIISTHRRHTIEWAFSAVFCIKIFDSIRSETLLWNNLCDILFRWESESFLQGFFQQYIRTDESSTIHSWEFVILQLLSKSPWSINKCWIYQLYIYEFMYKFRLNHS